MKGIHSDIWYTVRCQICLLMRGEEKLVKHILAYRRQWGRKEEWKSRKERMSFYFLLGQILDTILGKKGEYKIPVYFSLGNLKPWSGSEICSHVLNLKEACLNSIIIFYSILVFTDDSYHFKSSSTGVTFFSEFFAFIICIILYMKST